MISQEIDGGLPGIGLFIITWNYFLVMIYSDVRFFGNRKMYSFKACIIFPGFYLYISITPIYRYPGCIGDRVELSTERKSFPKSLCLIPIMDRS